jgi:hypothetical protein
MHKQAGRRGNRKAGMAVIGSRREFLSNLNISASIEHNMSILLTLIFVHNFSVAVRIALCNRQTTNNVSCCTVLQRKGAGRQTDRWADRWEEGVVSRQAGRQVGRQGDRQVSRQAGERTDRQ